MKQGDYEALEQDIGDSYKPLIESNARQWSGGLAYKIRVLCFIVGVAIAVAFTGLYMMRSNKEDSSSAVKRGAGLLFW